ncbi:hypothetical protein BST61_g1911 [Cercospora zeina]
MKFLTSVFGVLGSLSLLAATAEKPPDSSSSITTVADTFVSSASTIPIQRPIVKSSLQTSATSNEGDPVDPLAHLSTSTLQARDDECGPVCTPFSPSGVCFSETVDSSCNHHSRIGGKDLARRLPSHPPASSTPGYASGLTKLAPQDRVLAVLAGGFTAGMVDWRLGVLMLFASGLPERVGWGVQAAAVSVEGREEKRKKKKKKKKKKKEPDCRLVCTFIDPRHICQKYVCDCSGDWREKGVVVGEEVGVEDVPTATTQVGPNRIEARQYVKCTPWETRVPLAV